jgi:uncharacterized protein (DUF58 family)
MALPLASTVDWGLLAPLRLKAETIAEGLFAGTHRSRRRGAGIEFGGHRDYVPGDDLRWLDRRAMMRHDRLLVRQFETETDRAIRLVVDTTASMAFRSDSAPGAKLAFAAVVAAASARVALASGDPVALDWLSARSLHPLPSMGGKEAFSRIVSALEEVGTDPPAPLSLGDVDKSLAHLSRRIRRGSLVVVFSDFVDLPDGAFERIAALATQGRALIAVRVLDPAEATFSFSGPLRLRATETGAVTESDAETARAGYLAALEAQEDALRAALVPRGARLVRAQTTDDPITVVRDIAQATGGGRP